MMRKSVIFLFCLAFAGFDIPAYGASDNVNTATKPNIQLRAPVKSLPNNTAGTKQVSAAPLKNSISVTAPVDKEVWEPGSTHSIKWDYTGAPGKHVKISLFKGGKPVQELATSIIIGPIDNEAQKVFSWIIPNDIIQSDQYVVEVKSAENPNIKGTSNKFGIYGKIDVTEPNTVSHLYPDGNGIIRWTYNSKPGETVKVSVIKNGNPAGLITPTISIGSGGKGSCAWDTPKTGDPNDSYQIQVTSNDYPFVKGTSKVFNILGMLQVNNPKNGMLVHYDELVKAGGLKINGVDYSYQNYVDYKLTRRTSPTNPAEIAVAKGTANLSNHKFDFVIEASKFVKGVYHLAVYDLAQGTQNFIFTVD
jgi:hypothetical protein